MRIVFPSKWVKADDIGDERIVTIRQVDFDEDSEKGLTYWIKFDEYPDKKWTMNVTNFKTISKVLASEDSDDWIGKQITLYTTEVTFGGETTLGVRVRLKKPGATAPAAGPKPTHLGEAGEKWLLEQVAACQEEHPKATLEALRVTLGGQFSKHESMIASDPRNWPIELMPAIKKWLKENDPIPF